MENDKEEKKPTPPSPDKFKIDQEWADRLGIDFESERARYEAQHSQQPSDQQPQLPPTPDTLPPHPVPPVYTMPPASQLPPMHPDGPMPPTYMVWAILSTIFCCLPAGVVAIIFSSTVSSKYFARDYEGARRASHRAEIWIITSIVAGVIFNALYMPLSLLIP